MGACGEMSRKAKQCSFSKTISAGISRSRIFSNKVFSLMIRGSSKTQFAGEGTGGRAGTAVNFEVEIVCGQA